MVTHPKEEAFSIYYKALYDSPVVEDKAGKIRTFLGGLNLHKLSEQESKMMVEPITKEEELDEP